MSLDVVVVECSGLSGIMLQCLYQLRAMHFGLSCWPFHIVFMDALTALCESSKAMCG